MHNAKIFVTYKPPTIWKLSSCDHVSNASEVVPFAKRPSVGTWLYLALAEAAPPPFPSTTPEPKAAAAAGHHDNMRSVGSEDKLDSKFSSPPGPNAPVAKASDFEAKPKFAHHPRCQVLDFFATSCLEFVSSTV